MILTPIDFHSLVSSDSEAMSLLDQSALFFGHCMVWKNIGVVQQHVDSRAPLLPRKIGLLVDLSHRRIQLRASSR